MVVRGWERTAKEDKVSFWSDENVLKLMTVNIVYKYTTNELYTLNG